MSTTAQGEGAACAGLGGGAHAVTEPVGREPGAATERQGCGSMQRMVRRSSGDVECPRCDGKGSCEWMTTGAEQARGHYQCPDCGGSGELTAGMCAECGKMYGSRWPHDGCTLWRGYCGWCGEVKTVQGPEDFGETRMPFETRRVKRGSHETGDKTPNEEVSDRRAHDPINTTGANGGSLN